MGPMMHLRDMPSVQIENLLRSPDTMAHEEQAARDQLISGPYWRRVVSNRVAFNHDDRAQFSGKPGAEGNGAPKIRAQLWHAVY